MPLTKQIAYKVFEGRHTARKNIDQHYEIVMQCLKEKGITDDHHALMVLATIYVETGDFSPKVAHGSKYNTNKGGRQFGLYDGKHGNSRPGDGERYKGRGFVQITGRQNYQEYGKKINVNLEDNPEKATDPRIAAMIMAAYIHAHRRKIDEGLAKGDLRILRRAVNGGLNGYREFKHAFVRGLNAIDPGLSKRILTHPEDFEKVEKLTRTA